MKARVHAGMVLACGLVASVARAQSADSGGLMGTVIHGADGQPLTDVEVRVVGPSLLGDLRVLTDGDGHFRVPRLPPGLYTVVYLKEGYQSWERYETRVELGRTTRADMKLAREDVGCWFVARREGLDTVSTTTGLHVGPEFFRRIAVR
ncbi:carboxypeptidase-like regulatory domain-containing protein [Myxococcus stipitatus]|uniref:carboxypeptidase-like regulatory domain-containing protein n=1 Tax=Myxococcus stipitatus TaxID=83455 RepID=UPI001F3910AF|nr:carboxypeptidase-like regulatory domain-containing protein [Myxococcus stipitatus]MCE9668357.1 carboxypeptidase-like regulatory domain-containing protein [Myxococcus stipitatus]